MLDILKEKLTDLKLEHINNEKEINENIKNIDNSKIVKEIEKLTIEKDEIPNKLKDCKKRKIFSTVLFTLINTDLFLLSFAFGHTLESVIAGIIIVYTFLVPYVSLLNLKSYYNYKNTLNNKQIKIEEKIKEKTNLLELEKEKNKNKICKLKDIDNQTQIQIKEIENKIDSINQARNEVILDYCKNNPILEDILNETCKQEIEKPKVKVLQKS